MTMKPVPIVSTTLTTCVIQCSYVMARGDSHQVEMERRARVMR
jgi:hypothetical protein